MSATSCCHVFGDGSAALMVRSVRPFTLSVPGVVTLPAVLPFDATKPPATATNSSLDAGGAELGVVGVITANAVPPLEAVESGVVAAIDAKESSVKLELISSPLVISGITCLAVSHTVPVASFELAISDVPAGVVVGLAASLFAPVPLAVFDAKGSVSLIAVPPILPTLDGARLDARYWPKRAKFAVSELSLVVSVAPEA